MTKYQQNYQPGPVFHDAFLAGMRAKGLSSRTFAEKYGYYFQNLRSYSTGWTNGEKARTARDQMIEEIGPALFETLYAARMAQECQK
jgi:hypothetical protein